MSTRFTEGSWRAEVGSDDLCETLSVTIMKNDADADDEGRTIDASYSILEDGHLVLESDLENYANAHLIAAAPDLYDALAELRRCLDVPGNMTAAIRNADMALAYARGEQWRYDDE